MEHGGIPMAQAAKNAERVNRVIRELSPSMRDMLIGETRPVRIHFDSANPCDGSEDCGVSHA